MPADFPQDLNFIPLSEELSVPILAGLLAAQQEPANTPDFADQVVHDDLMLAIQRPQTRQAAGQDLYSRWVDDPTNFLWATLAIRYDYLLNMTTELDAVLETPALADTSLATGAFAFALQNYGYGSRGRFYNRASQAGGMSTLNQLLLLRKTAMVESHQGHHLSGVRNMVAALPEVRLAGGARLETRYWFTIALNLQRADRLDDALHAAAMGLHLATQTENLAYEGLFLKLLAGLLDSRQEYDAALSQYEAVIDFASQRDLPWIMLSALYKAGELCSRQGRVDEALVFDRRNLVFSLSISDSLNAPRGMINLADDFLQLGQVDSSLVYQEKARIWVERFPNRQNQTRLPALLAEYYCHIGDYDTVDSLLTLASDRSSRTGLALEEATLLIGLINQGVEMSNLDLALRSMQRLEQLHPLVFDGQANQNFLADFELVTADLSLALGDFKPAREALDRSMQAVEAGAGVEQKWHYHQSAGRLSVLRGDFTTAADEFSDGLLLAVETGNPVRMANSRHLLGRILLVEGKTAEARDLFVNPDQDPSFGGSFRTRLTNLWFQGRSWRLEGETDVARKILENATALFTPYSPADVTAGIHLELGRCFVELGLNELADINFEKATANLDGMNKGTNADNLAGYLDNTRRQLAEAVIARYLSSETKTFSEDQVEKALMVANQTLLLADIPKLEVDEKILESPISAPGSDCLGLYFLGTDQSYLWVGHDNHWSVSVLPGKKSLENLAFPVFADLQQPHRTPDHTALENLGQTLLGPIQQSWITGERLTIVADGFLKNIPWTALIIPEANGQMALLRGPVVETSGLPAPTPESSPGLVGTGSLLAIGYNGFRQQNDRLINAEKEARIIADTWSAGPAQALIGAEARWSEAVLEQMIGISVLHLATHARVQEGLGSESFLVMANEDGVAPLTGKTISNWSWNGDLVFLSSCDAGRSHLSGQSMTGLAGAFIYAGAKAVISSAGKVDDEAGLFLAQSFYQHWLDGKSRANALRAARLDLISERPQWAHPYYWSRYRLFI